MFNNLLGDTHFPAWCGPLLGAVVGLLIGVRMSFATEDPFGAFCIVGTLIGALAGSFMILLEGPKTLTGQQGNPSATPAGLSTIAGEAVAVVSALTCWIPVFGFIVSGVAVWMNWRAIKWVRLATVIAFGLSSIMMVPVIIIVAGLLIDGPPK